MRGYDFVRCFAEPKLEQEGDRWGEGADFHPPENVYPLESRRNGRIFFVFVGNITFG